VRGVVVFNLTYLLHARQPATAAHLGVPLASNALVPLALQQILVLYYSHSCGHSRNFLQAYADASNAAFDQRLPVIFSSVNCGRPGNNEYCTSVDVSEYPSVRFNALTARGALRTPAQPSEPNRPRLLCICTSVWTLA
jgi:hypothetical protein